MLSGRPDGAVVSRRGRFPSIRAVGSQVTHAMKIGIVVPKLAGGGAEYVAREWATFLLQAGLDVFVIATERVENPGHYPFRVLQLQSRSFLGRIKDLQQIISNEGLSALVALMPYWNLLALAAGNFSKSSRTAVVISSHTIESPYGVIRRRSFAVQMALARCGYRYADALVASSHPVAAEAVARYGIQRDRLWVVPNPVFPQEMNENRGSRRKLGRPLTIVVPGRLVDQKRPRLAVDVAAALGLRWGTAPNVIFVGDGPAKERTMQDAEEAGISATFKCWDSDWAVQIPDNSIVLLPSMLEGFGNVLLDAAASGVPAVVSSRALGAADAVLPGITGVLVTGDQVADYVHGVLRVAEDIAFDQNTVDCWLNRFTRQNSGQQLLAILTNLPRID